LRETYNAKPELKSLVPVRDRITFLYVEHCVINRDAGAITVTNAKGQVNVPSSLLCVLLLGPGSELTHSAMELMADAGTTVVWTGEFSVRFYAGGRPLTHSSRLLLQQAALVSNTRKRLAVARKMYAIRFGHEKDTSKFTMQQLRGREGARMREVYRTCSKNSGIPWDGREYDPDDFNASNDINKALSAANICLYGLAHSVIVSLGLSPGLGFVHTGHERSFVYDIADLYKADITIPTAFRVTAESPEDLESSVRHELRDEFSNGRLLERMVNDLFYLLSDEKAEENQDAPETDVLKLWDEKEGGVNAGVLYLPFDDEE